MKFLRLLIRNFFILGKIQASFCQEQENVRSDLLITECQSVGIMLVASTLRLGVTCFLDLLDHTIELRFEACHEIRPRNKTHDLFMAEAPRLVPVANLN